MGKSGKAGEKFVDKYGVQTANIYKAGENTRSVKIPGPDHPLYDPTAPTTFDPIRVEAIDRDGKMTTAIEVWSDPDEGILWVLDGRGRFLDVEEVNRRRKKEGRELVQPYLVPFPGDEKAAIARVREKNYHRRLPTPSGMALDVSVMRRAGHSFEACCKALHVDSADPEQFCRKLLPLAYCIPEVQAAVDSGELPRSAAPKFGGTAPDGSKALGKKAQVDLLAEMRAEHEKQKDAGAPKPVGRAQRERVRHALGNGASEKLKAAEREVANIVAATIARMEGDAKALKDWPAVAAVVEEALKPLPKGPKAKSAER